MSRITGAIREMQTIEESASRDQWVNRIHPLVKFCLTILYLICVISCGRYDLSRVLGLALYPFLMFELSGLPFGEALYRLRIVLPLVCIVGIFNPLLDRRPGAEIFGFTLTMGLLSMLTLMIKGILTVLSSYLLVASTPVDDLCAAMRMIHAAWQDQVLALWKYQRVNGLYTTLIDVEETYCETSATAAIAYGVLFLMDLLFKADFRIWTFAFKTFDFNIFPAILRYLPTFLLFYVVSTAAIRI